MIKITKRNIIFDNKRRVKMLSIVLSNRFQP